MVTDEFEQMDTDAGVVGSVMTTQRGLMAPQKIAEYRKELVKQYHNGAPSLVARLKASGSIDTQSLIVSLIDEVITETDNLLGNQLVATENGELRDASVISFKRAEILEKAIKAVQSKAQMEKESGIDLDSPSMMVIFRFFMRKSKEALEKNGIMEDQIDLFFQTLGGIMEFWKKELREDFDEMKAK
jgi:hypothetical protein